MKVMKINANLKVMLAITLFSLPFPVSVLAAPPLTSELTAKGPNGALSGTLIETGQASPLIIIIPGSGPTDRDGNNPLGVTASSYRLLADALAKQGISSLRIDKRGMFGSASAADPNKVTIADYVTDITNWISAIQTKTKRPCVWLLGHSEGGLVALAAGQQNKSVCGVILAAAPGRKLSDSLRAQINGNPANAPIKEDAMKVIATLETGKTVDVSTLHPALQGLFNPDVQPFLIDLFSKDPAILANSLSQPLLIVQGARDIQVTLEDANLLLRAQPKAKLITFPTMTHVLKDADNESPQANMATYTNASRPLNSDMVNAVSAFVKQK
jgi:uncharacterized protein